MELHARERSLALHGLYLAHELLLVPARINFIIFCICCEY